MFQILMVCTANICRSPVAQALMEESLTGYLADTGQGAKVRSAGTMATDGNPADMIMYKILSKMKEPVLSDKLLMSLANHCSRLLMPSMISAFDLILCMEQEHLDWVCKIQPVATGKTKLLGHWNGGEQIADPIGRSLQEYEHAIARIKSNVEQWSNKIIQLGLCA